MKSNYAISTFCFGERYYKQTNRMIESFELLESPPQIFIITDNPNEIQKKDFVNIKNVGEYNAKYLKYETNYYGFDFSVKRFSVRFAFENGYNKIILADTDVVVNQSLYSHERILECFLPNTIAGQTTYSFKDSVFTNSELGKRLLHYEIYFDVCFRKSLLDFMPEDCIQFIDIEDDKKFKFLNTWDECIRMKDKYNLKNTPAGNIDEMCFSALYNDLSVDNNSNKHINLLTAKHDKWY